MAANSLGPTLGPVLAPVEGSLITIILKIRWCFYVLAVDNFVVAITGAIFFNETYLPRVLKFKADKISAETGNSHSHTIYEIAQGEKFASRMIFTILRH